MSKREIIMNNVALGEIEELTGYVIEEIAGETDASGDGFYIKAYREIDGVRIYRMFEQREGACYMSQEYIPEK